MIGHGRITLVLIIFATAVHAKLTRPYRTCRKEGWCIKKNENCWEAIASHGECGHEERCCLKAPNPLTPPFLPPPPPFLPPTPPFLSSSLSFLPFLPTGRCSDTFGAYCVEENDCRGFMSETYDCIGNGVYCCKEDEIFLIKCNLKIKSYCSQSCRSGTFVHDEQRMCRPWEHCCKIAPGQTGRLLSSLYRSRKRQQRRRRPLGI